MSLYLLVVPACLFPALAIPRPTEVCVRGARVQRGDQRTEPRRLSGVSSRPVKVGAAGTRLALWNAGTFWTRHLGISQRAALLRSSRQRLPRRPTHFLHNKALSSSSRQDIPAADLPRAEDLRRRIFSSLRVVRDPPRVYTMATTVVMPSPRQREDVYEAFTRLTESCDNFDRDAAITACKDGAAGCKLRVTV